MKKVAHLLEGDPSVLNSLSGQLDALAELGCEVVLLSTWPEAITRCQVPYLRCVHLRHGEGITLWNALPAFVELISTLRRERFDLIHTHSLGLGLLGHAAARFAHAPLCFHTVHGHPLSQQSGSPLISWLQKAGTRLLASVASVIYSKNREDTQTFLRERLCPAGKLRFLGDGIDLRHFHRATLNPCLPPEARLRLGLGVAGPVVGFVGRVVVEKGVLELLEAAQIVLEKQPDTRFLFVGPLDEAEIASGIDPRQIAAELGVARAVVFAGTQSRKEMPALYALMNVLVRPSHREGYSHALMEACAMQVPCVVSDVAGNREIIEQGHNGWLLPRGEVRGLAEDILRLLGDPATAREMGRIGRELAEARFSETAVFERLQTDYAHFLGISRPSRGVVRLSAAVADGGQ